jgi:hypothetical protein
MSISELASPERSHSVQASPAPRPTMMSCSAADADGRWAAISMASSSYRKYAISGRRASESDGQTFQAPDGES